jgi:hypothetical protein
MKFQGEVKQMKRNIVLFAAAGYALVAMTSAAIAAPKPMAKKAAAKASATTMKCPACGMPMPMKKNAMMTIPVKVGKKTFYCCPQCPAGKAMAARMKKKAA